MKIKIVQADAHNVEVDARKRDNTIAILPNYSLKKHFVLCSYTTIT